MFIILCVLLAYILITPFFYFKAVKFGMKIVGEPAKAMNEPVFVVPTPKKEQKITPQEDRWNQINANLDRYVGDATGQIKVEVKND